MRHTVSERRKKWFFLRSMFRAFWEHLDKHNSQRRSKPASRPLFAEALEARVLFSAAPVPVEQDQEPVDEAPVAQEAGSSSVAPSLGYADTLLALGSDLKGYWKFEGNVADASGNNTSAALMNGATYASTSAHAALGQGLSLDGGNDYLATGATATALGLNGSFTAGAWINADSFTQDRAIFGTDAVGNSTGLHLVIRNGTPLMGFYGDDLSGSQTLNTGTWYNIVFRYDAVTNQQSIFINGQLHAQRTSSNDFLGTTAVNIGRWGGGSYFDGVIDEAFIAGTALSDAQILALHDSAPNPSAVVPDTTVTVSGGNLTISDTDGGITNDNLTLTVAGTDFSVVDSGNGFSQTVGSSSFTGDIIVNGGGGDDTLTIDLSGGAITRNIVFNGGAGGNDTLVVTGGAFGTVTYDATNAFDGVLDFGTFTVTFTGLEPVDLTGLTVDDYVINVDPSNTVAGGHTTTIEQVGGTDTRVSITGGFEHVLLRTVNGSLTINGEAGENDTITLTGVGTSFAGGLTINGGTGNDTVNLNGDVTFAAGKSLSVTAESLNTAAGADLVTSGAGTVTLTADDVALNGTSTIVSGGTVTLAPQTAARQINLGTETAGQLSLTDAELDRITAATIQIGDTNSGAITVSAAISRAAATNLSLTTAANQNLAFSGAGSLSAGNGNVTLTTSGTGAITSGTAAADIMTVAGRISLNAGSGGIGASGNGISLSTAIGLGLTTTTSGNGNQFLRSAGSTVIAPAGLDAGTGSINLESGTLILAGSNRIADTSDVVISGGATLDLGTSSETIDQLVLVDGSVTGTGTLTGTSTFDLRKGSISAKLGGSVGLTKTTADTVALSGANTFLGNTLVSAGTLRLASNNSITAGTITIEGTNTILQLVGSVTMARDLIISDSGDLKRLDLGTGNYTGTITINETGAQNFVIEGTSNQNATVDGKITGSGGAGVRYVTDATISVGGDNDYTGPTFISLRPVIAKHNNAFSAGTVTLGASGASIQLADGVNLPNDLVISNNGDGKRLALQSGATSGTYSGDILIQEIFSNVDISVNAGATLYFTGNISSTAGAQLTLISPGTVVLSGTNTYTGATAINQGILDVDGTHTGGGTYSIAGLATLRGSGSITANISGAPGSAIVSDGAFVIGNIASATGFSTDGTVTIPAGQSLTINDSNLAVLGTSTVVNGTLTKGGSQGFSLSASETLSGHGTINGAVTTNSATIAPGNSPGILATGNLDLDGGTYNVELGGTTPGNLSSNHDQISVTGSVILGAGTATLNIAAINGFVPAATNSFVIIANDGTDPVNGTFAGLPEGTTFTSGGNTYTISYKGGDGNDVILFGGAGETRIALDGSNRLVFSDIGAGNSNDRLTIRFDSGTNEYVISDSNLVLITDPSLSGNSFTRPDGNTLRVAAAAITGVEVNSNGGDDFLTIDLSTGALPVNVVFNGGMQATAAGDALRILGSGTQSAIYTPHATIAGNGLITLGAQTVTFTGLEPVDFDSLASVTVTLPGANDILTVANGFDSATGLLPALVVSGTSNAVAIEAAHIRNVGSVTIDTTTVSGNDTITVTSASNAHGIGNLSILTGTGTDTMNVNGAVTVSGDITFTTGQINIANNADISSTGAGNISLTADGGTREGLINNGGDITTTLTGNITIIGTGGDDNDEDGIVFANNPATISTGSGTISITGSVSVTTGNADDGIEMANVTISTGGAVSITGTGGNRGSLSDGIEITGVSQITAGGAITLNGTSGDGGVVFDASTLSTGITTSSGNISITGTRADAAGIRDLIRLDDTRVDTASGSVTMTSTAPGGSGYGILIGGASDIEATTGITLDGDSFGGGGVRFVVSGAGNGITTDTGNISITGNGIANEGVRIQNATHALAVTTTGTGTITISGTGASNNDQDGVFIGGFSAGSLSTGSGAISITGRVGDPNSNADDGVDVRNMAIGTTGSVSITGTGGNRGSTSFGIRVTGVSHISSGAAITLSGTSGEGGVSFDPTAGGLGIVTSNGNISITGTRADSAGDRDLILLDDTRVDTASGSVTMTSTAPGGSGYGIWIGGASDIEATTGITLNGNSSGGGGIRMVVSGAGNGITTDTGNISITGNGVAFEGVRLQNATDPLAVTTTGTGTITIAGTGGSNNDQDGVYIGGFGASSLSTGSGAISITGQSGVTNSNADDGVQLNNMAIGTTGSVSITGTGGNRGATSFGIRVTGVSQISAGAAITLSGTSGEGGVSFDPTAGGLGIVTSSGDISISGTRADSAGDRNLIVLDDTRVDTASGSVTMTSTAPGGTGYGILITGASDIEATTGITLNGNSSGGGGIRMVVSGAGNGITTDTGNISITGNGVALEGVRLQNATDPLAVTTTGTGTITIAGTGGSNNDQDGVHIGGFGASSLSTGSGAISITGQSGVPNSTADDGVELSNIAIGTTGSVSITGTGGNRGGTSFGIRVTGVSQISAGAAITLSGTSGEGGVSFNPTAGGLGIVTSSGNISISGTRADSAGDRDLIFLDDTRVDTAGGSVTMTSTAPGGTGYGIQITGASDIEATTGISLNGNSFGGGGVRFVVSGAGNGITTDGGNISITGNGVAGEGVRLQNATNPLAVTTTGTGTITIAGTGASIAGQDAVNIQAFGGTTISTGSGAIDISGQAAVSLSDAGDGVYLSGSTVSTSGAISVTGTGGNRGGIANGVELAGATSIASSGAGAVTVTGNSPNPGQTDLVIGGTSTVSSVSGLVTITGDEISLTSTAPKVVSATGNHLRVQPFNDAGTIGIGNGATGALLANVAFLDKLAISDAHTLTIGRATGTGNVDIRPVNRSAEGEDFHFIGGNINVNTLNVGTNNLTLTSNTGSITDASGTDITAANVTLNGTVTPGQSPGILVVAGNTTINNGVTFEFDGNAGAGLVNGHDRIDVTGTVTLNATTSTVTIDTTDLINTEIAAGDEIVLIDNDGIDAITGTFSNATLSRNLVNSNVAGTNLDLVLRYNGGTGNDVSVLVGNVTTRVFVDGSGNLVIEDVDDTTNDQITVQVVGTNLVITEADSNIFIDALGFTGDLTNQVTVPLASFTGNVILRLGAGDDAIVFDDVDLTGTRGLTVENGLGTDTVTFQTNSSDLANGNITIAAETITVNAAVNAGTAGNVALNATTGNLALNANLATGGAGTIDLDAGGTITQGAATTISTGSGNITLDAAGAITLTGISTTGNITATSTGGAILDAGDTNTDLSAPNVTLSGTAIGASGNAISTTTSNLTTNTSTAGGNQFLTETDSLTAINLAAGAGTINLTTGGAISDTDGSADLAAAAVVVTVTSGDFGAAGNAIGTTVASLSVNTATGNGSQWISETDGLTALSLDAGTGNVTLSAGGAITDTDPVPLDVIATNLAVTSAGFGTVGNLIATQVSNFEANGGAGGIFVGNNGNLTIGGVNASLSGLDTTAGGIQIRITGTLTTSEAIDATGGEVRLVANSMALGAAVASSGGNLILAPFVGSTTIGVGGGSGTLNLDDAELALLTDGFNSITIGDASAGTGAVDVDSSTFTDNVTIVGATIAVTELSAGTNNATLIARTGAITDGGDAGTDVTAALVTLNANGAIGASGDAISLAATSIATNSNLIAANGNQFLTTATSVTVTGFNAGTGVIEISGGEFDLTANNVVNNATSIVVETGTTLDADGTDTFAGVTVRSGGFLKGDGNLQTTPVTIQGGATLTPGEGASGTGDLGTGNLTFNSAGVYSVNINGNTAVTQYDQLVVTGTVNLGNATLSLAPLGYVPTAGHTYILISNDGADPVTGIFAGLVEGSYVSAAVVNGTPPPAFLPDQLFQISYVGGDGNDVVLTAAAVVATTNIRIDGSGNLLVEDILGGATADNLSISRVGSNFVIEDLSGNPLGTLIPGATQPTLSRVQVPAALVTGGVLVNTLGGDDIINIDGFSGGAASFGSYLLVDGGTGVDTINVNGDVTVTSADGTNRSVDLQGDIILVDAGVDLVTSSATGTVSLIANRNLFMDGNSRIQTVGGNITLSANLAGTETGNFAAVRLRGADLTSTTGNVSLTGQGGNSGNSNRGVSIEFDTATSATTEITTGGSVILNGTGGAGGQQGHGVFIDRGTVQSTGAGPVTITGTGGAGTQSNDGISIFAGFVDAGSGNLSLTGTGASTGSFNRGVAVGSGWLISAGGNVSVLGTGAGTALSAAYSLGVEIVDSVVGTFGTGTVTLHGTGANGTQHNVGLKVHSTSVAAENGLIDLRGTGQGNNVSNVGLQIMAASDVRSSGTGAINVDGTGSTTGTTGNHGVEIASDSVVQVAAGNLTIDGTGNGTLQSGKGVVLSVSLLETTGSGDIFVNGTGSATTTLGTSRGIETITGRIRSTGTGDITLIGTGGTGNSLNQGVVLASTTTISTASGDLMIQGNGGGAGATSGGVHVHASSNLSVGGSGNLTILGTGALGTNSNEGVQISSTSVVTTVNGALVITGTGRGTGQLNSGVLLSNSTLSSTGSGNLIITGAGTSSAATGSNNKGITMSGGAMNTATGNITLVGTGGRGVSTNEGIRISSAVLRSTGGGSLSLTGAALGTTTGTQNTGVFLTSVTLDTSGSKTILGTGGGGTATSSNHGVYMQSMVIPLAPAPAVTGTKGTGSASRDTTGNFFP
jgi:hypothetical protein